MINKIKALLSPPAPPVCKCVLRCACPTIHPKWLLAVALSMQQVR